MIHLTNAEVKQAAEVIAHKIYSLINKNEIKIYGIPRGGVPVAYLVAGSWAGSSNYFTVVDNPEEADVFVDDLIDSGKTQVKWCQKPFFVLFDKRQNDRLRNQWVVFPWEGTIEGSFEDNITRLLQFIGEDPAREGLKETPARVTKAWQQWCSGYGVKPGEVLKTFEDGAKGYDEMVLVKDIPFYSHCEHHLAPFFGTVTVAYIPDGKIVGLSKINRLVEIFARRLQVQERMTAQIADALEEHLKPLGVGVLVRARHLCTESRGVKQQGHSTVTSKLVGVLKDVPEARAEFLSL